MIKNTLTADPALWSGFLPGMDLPLEVLSTGELTAGVKSTRFLTGGIGIL